MPVGDIAEAVGLSTTPCWRRIKRLEADGVISGRAVLLDAEKLGLAVNVFADIRLKLHDEETLIALENALAAQPEIMECFSVSGESDYIVRVVAESIRAYEVFLKKVLLHMPGVAAVNSRFALGCIKMTTALPI